MSSHHFVKEGQEPALLIFDAIGLNVIEPLLEWAPLVVVTEDSLEYVLTWGIKIDAVVGKSVNNLKMVLAHQAPVRLIETKQDYITASLDFLIDTKQFNVSISASHPESLILSLEGYHAQMEISVLTPTSRWSHIRQKKYSKWMVKHTHLNFFGNDSLLLNGQPLSGNSLLTDKDGTVELSAARPFWVIEDY